MLFISTHSGPIDGFQVIFRTDKLEDTHYVAEYDIKHMSTIHTVLYVPGGFWSGHEHSSISLVPSDDNN